MKIIVEDVYEHILQEIANNIWDIWSKAGYEVSVDDIYESLEEPPLERFGDIALPTFRFSKEFKVDYKELISRTLCVLDSRRVRVISKIDAVGGYINFFIDEKFAAKELFNTISNIGYGYGLKTIEKPLRIVVEHTSANPVHPLHIGHGRNAVLGDVLSRILTKRGHKVIRRFYINDMGRQVAILAYGCLTLGNLRPTSKPDHFYGLIYSATNAIIEIDRLKRELERAKKKGDYVEMERINSELLDWLNVLAELKSKNYELVM
ncbi:MAG: arginine--tRNA ligase, partial [Thermoprotei archaeon]